METKGNAGTTPAKQAAAKKAEAKKTETKPAAKPASKKADPENKAEGNADQNKSDAAAGGGAGGMKGNFVCTRPMTGDQPYVAGDKRELRIGQALNMLKSGALQPADQKTLDAAKKLKPDLELKIYKKPSSKKDD